MALDTPVLFVVFNRPDTTSKVLSAIRQAQPRQLFIAADGPRTFVEADLVRCRKVRDIVAQVDWDCEVKTLFQDRNLGCRIGPATAISWFFENVERGIILEDDCLPQQSFFRYCEELLEYYKNDKRIFSINGSNLGYATNESSYTFSKFMNMWGWATWRRVATLIDYDLTYWKNMRFKKLWLYRKLHVHDYLKIDFRWIHFWEEHLYSLLDGFETWDYQWVYHQLKYNAYSIVPSKNMVTNIGFGHDATHTHDPNFPVANIRSEALEFPIKHPDAMKDNIDYLNRYVKTKWCGCVSRWDKLTFKHILELFNKGLGA